MKIAYLNPWENAAENQAYASLSLAADQLGHSLIDCRTATDVESACPDFVISVASSIPKAADFPTYLTVHEPKSRFLGNAFYLQNLLTYDGYMTISDSIHAFVQDVVFGVGRDNTIGFYFNTPQVNKRKAQLSRIIDEDNLRLVYLGTNWDQRLPQLFRSLDASGILKIHGPRASWDSGDYLSYHGPLPFDGISPQMAYFEAGMGLVLLSEAHLREDIISNRIFEIASVGAVAICPDIPWIRKWFGDTVLYFDPNARPRTIASQIRQHYRFCLERPNDAQTKADAARDIFERIFCAERMIANAVDYHVRKTQLRRSPVGNIREPHISVIVRCGGRPVSMIRDAVDSIRKQTFGRFTVILSKYRAIDLSEVTADRSGPVRDFIEILNNGGNRSVTLSAGLMRVQSEFFAILDDDDFWMSDHIESIFDATAITDRDFDVAFSGSVAVSVAGVQIEKSLSWDRNIYTFGPATSVTSAWQVCGNFSSNCFVARTELLTGGLHDLGQLNTAEDSLLISILTRRKPPVFTYKATAFFRRGFEGESGFTARHDRADDELAWSLRAGLLLAPRWLPSPAVQVPLDTWQAQRNSLRGYSSELSMTTSVPEVLLVIPTLEVDDADGWDVTSLMSVGNAGRKSSEGFEALLQVEGHVCYGPYLPLPPGNYRAEFQIRNSRPRTAGQKDRSPQKIGLVDIICIEPPWIGACQDIFGDGTLIIPFTIPDDLKGRTELRVLSHGMTSFVVGAVILWQLL